MKNDQLELVFDRNDVYPWPWVFADEVLSEKYGLKAIEEYRDGYLYHYAAERAMEAISRQILKKALKDPSYYRRVKAEIRKRSRALLTFAKTCEKKRFEFLLDRELFRDVSEYVKRLKVLRVWGWIPVLIEGVTTPLASEYALSLLRKELPKKSQAELNEIFPLLTTPDELSLIQKARIETLELASALGKRLASFVRARNANAFIEGLPRELRARVKRHIQTFRWTTFNYEGPTLNAPLLQSALKGLTPAKAHIEMREIKRRVTANRKKKKTLLASLPLSKDTRTILSLLCESMLMKEYRKVVYQQSYAMMESPIREISRRIGIPPDQCKFLSLSEMETALKRPRTLAKLALARRKYCVVVVSPKKTEWHHGKAAEKLVKKLTQYQTELTAQLKGQVAYAGFAEGSVKVVLTVKDLAKMKKGDILVSSATNPDLLPGIKIAGAIVTDTGGIISHAAIVSRELQIPCVVGVKQATKILKDGDTVRVDAKEGVVTKL